MTTRFCLPSLLLAAVAASAQDLDSILARVAEHQETAQEARTRIVYTQHVHARLVRANGKLAREEKRTYTVTPTEKSIKRELVKFEGWYERKGKMIPYDTPGHTYKGLDIDGELIDDMINDWTGDGGSKDGLDHDQFPLRKERQQEFRFANAGMTRTGSADVMRLTYEPKQKGSSPWRGEVLLDPAELHPLHVSSTFTFKMPTAVKVIFGTNIRQVGFNVKYAKAIDDLWFPVSYGTELYFRVLFGYARTLTLSMTNSDFRRGSAESTVQYEEIAKAEQK